MVLDYKEAIKMVYDYFLDPKMELFSGILFIQTNWFPADIVEKFVKKIESHGHNVEEIWLWNNSSARIDWINASISVFGFPKDIELTNDEIKKLFKDSMTEEEQKQKEELKKVDDGW